MKERPIIFSGPMVRAIQAGQKTQTRRIVKPQPLTGYVCSQVLTRDVIAPSGYAWSSDEHGDTYLKYPHGGPGDHLWVREAWRVHKNYDGLSPLSLKPYETVRHEADGASALAHGWGRLRPSIHMPRLFSRITLEVTGVRCERVQDITGPDLVAEGFGVNGQAEPFDSDARFINLWNAMHAKRGHGWDANPFVWVYEFRRAA